MYHSADQKDIARSITGVVFVLAVIFWHHVNTKKFSVCFILCSSPDEPFPFLQPLFGCNLTVILDLLLSAAGQFNSVSSLSEIKKVRREGRKEEGRQEGGRDRRGGREGREERNKTLHTACSWLIEDGGMCWSLTSRRHGNRCSQ